MRKNTTGLKQSARLRSEQAMERALAALHCMDASDREIRIMRLLELAYGVIATKGHCVSSTASEQSSEACVCDLTPPD